MPANRTCDASYLARHAWWDTEKEYINTIWDVSSVPLFSKCLIFLNYLTPPLGTKKLSLLKLFAFLPKTVPLHESGALCGSVSQ